MLVDTDRPLLRRSHEGLKYGSDGNLKFGRALVQSASWPLRPATYFCPPECAGWLLAIGSVIGFHHALIGFLSCQPHSYVIAPDGHIIYEYTGSRPVQSR